MSRHEVSTHEGTSRRPGPTVGRMVASCILATVLLAGCTTVRSSLGTSDSSCYLALPTANQAVHSAGRLVGVHVFTGARLRKDAPRLFNRLAVPIGSQQRICVIEFTGSFKTASVVKPRGVDAGHLALVVVEAPSNELLGTVVLDRPPLRFNHTHIG